MKTLNANTSDERMLQPHVDAAFLRFHGMLCGPAAAQRCIRAFTGSIVFMPASYEPAGFLCATEQQSRLPYEVTSLSLMTYYGLVLGSLTGLCTALKLTRILEASSSSALLPSSSSSSEPTTAATQPLAEPPQSHPLAVHPQVVEALAARHGVRGQPSSVKLVRRFEFRFRLVGLWVAMSHYLARDERGRETLSLVEVYRVSKVCAAAAWAGVALILDFVLRRALSAI